MNHLQWSLISRVSKASYRSYNDPVVIGSWQEKSTKCCHHSEEEAAFTYLGGSRKSYRGLKELQGVKKKKKKMSSMSKLGRVILSKFMTSTNFCEWLCHPFSQLLMPETRSHFRLHFFSDISFVGQPTPAFLLLNALSILSTLSQP